MSLVNEVFRSNQFIFDQNIFIKTNDLMITNSLFLTDPNEKIEGATGGAVEGAAEGARGAVEGREAGGYTLLLTRMKEERLFELRQLQHGVRNVSREVQVNVIPMAEWKPELYANFQFLDHHSKKLFILTKKKGISPCTLLALNVMKSSPNLISHSIPIEKDSH